jgi:flavodoxin
MKAVIFHYSSTGNTHLACQYLARRIKNVEFDLVDITHGNDADVSSYDVVGFAAPTFHMGVPPLLETFLQNFPVQADKPAFVFNTYGGLLAVLQRLVDAGNTVVVIEHNLDVIKAADWIIDLGPEGGQAGGQIVAEGTPERVAQVATSYTGKFLRSLQTN